MKPSSDIALFTTTLPFPVLVLLICSSWSALPVTPVLQFEDPGRLQLGAGDQVEPVGLGDVVEQRGALVRNVGVQAQVELVDQVELHERPPEGDTAPDNDVAVTALPELVDLFRR